MRCTQWPTSASGSGMLFDLQPAVDRPPSLRRHRRVRNAPAAEMAMKIRLRIARIEDDRVQAHAARARLPRCGRSRVRASPEAPATFAPPSVERKIAASSTPGVNRVRIGQRRLEMPDALEFPRVRRAVVPLMRARDALVDELVADRRPASSAIVRALQRPARTNRWIAMRRDGSGSTGEPLT